MGYHRAGFDVVGVDVKPQPRYPFMFVQSDALEFLKRNGRFFDAIHASPPCQAYSQMQNIHNAQHPELVGPVREALKASGKPYVIENVVGAPLHCPIVLCGTMFDLTATDFDGATLFLRRHRLFESNRWLTVPIACRCVDFKAKGWLSAGVYGGGSTGRFRVTRGAYVPAKRQRTELIDAPWMSLHGLSQSIPPAYTEWVGRQILTSMEIAA